MAVDPASGTVYTVSAALGPKPPASPSNPKRRPSILPDSFVVLVYLPDKIRDSGALDQPHSLARDVSRAKRTPLSPSLVRDALGVSWSDRPVP